MAHNPYDDAAFFEAYGQMDRSRGGLAAAGEWHALEALMPPLAGRQVLDLGCGYGWHCICAAQQGAARVLGIDISQRMLAVAREKSAGLPIEYRQVGIDEYDYPRAAFDVVLSSLALHYIEDFGAVCAGVAATLRPGGVFLFSCEHPVFTARQPQQWVQDEAGGKLHWPVDDYFMEGGRQMVFLGQPIKKYHRTLTGILAPLRQNGLAIDAVVEPMPGEEHLRAQPGMRDELRRPMMLIVKAVKPA